MSSIDTSPFYMSIIQRAETSLANFLTSQVPALTFHTADSDTYLTPPYGAVVVNNSEPLDVRGDQVDKLDVFVLIVTDIDNSLARKSLDHLGDTRRALESILYSAWKDEVTGLALYGGFIRAINRENRPQSRRVVLRLQIACGLLEESTTTDC